MEETFTYADIKAAYQEGYEDGYNRGQSELGETFTCGIQ